MLNNVRIVVNDFKIHRALEEIWRVVGDANAYIDEQAPWTLRKQDPERMKTVLYVLSEAIRCLALIVQPVMPHSASSMLDQLKINADERDFAMIDRQYALKAGTEIDKPQGVFPRLAVDEVAA